MLPELREVNKTYQDLANRASALENKDYTKDDSRTAVENSLSILNTRIMKARWQPRL